jgi:hypothetical protein
MVKEMEMDRVVDRKIESIAEQNFVSLVIEFVKRDERWKPCSRKVPKFLNLNPIYDQPTIPTILFQR